jgi:hypothetical protein
MHAAEAAFNEMHSADSIIAVWLQPTETLIAKPIYMQAAEAAFYEMHSGFNHCRLASADGNFNS